MDRRLIFRGYATNDLDVAAEKFQEQIGKQVEVFLKQANWEVYGTQANQRKVMISTLAGFASVYIPVYLNREELEAIESSRSEKRMFQASPFEREMREIYAIAEELKYTRYCNYCGCKYITDPNNVIYHCGKTACVQQHEGYIKHVEKVRQEGRSSKPEKAEIIKRIPTPDFSLEDTGLPSDKGVVYLIEAENSLYKIGRSNNIADRFLALVTASPVRLYLRHTIESRNCVEAEFKMHQQFSCQRHHGEWFQLSEESVKWITELDDYSLDKPTR